MMQVAQGRLGVIDSVSKVQSDAASCVSSLTSLPRFVRYGALAGASVLGMGVAHQLLRFSRAAKAPAAPVRESSLIRYLVAQAATLVLLPWLRQRMLQPGGSAVPPRKWKLPTAFFRWLGLEK